MNDDTIHYRIVFAHFWCGANQIDFKLHLELCRYTVIYKIKSPYSFPSLLNYGVVNDFKQNVFLV